MLKFFIYILVLISNLFNVPVLHSQVYDAEKLERIFEKISEETNSIPIYDQFEKLIENPIKLKNARVEDLIGIPYLSLPEIQKIIDYISNNNILTYSGIYDVVNLNPDERYLFRIMYKD